MDFKALKIFFVIALLSVTFASCKDKDDDGDDAANLVYYDLTLDAGQPSNEGVPMTEGVSWSSSDEIAAINLIYKRDIVDLKYDGSKFRASVPTIASSCNVGYFYPASAVAQAKSDTTYVRINYGMQDGVNVASYRAGSTSATISGTTATAKVNMATINCIANLTFTSEGNPIQNISHIELSAAKGAIYGSGDYELKSLEFTTRKTNNIAVVSNTGLNGKARIGMIPSIATIAATVVTADGKCYEGVQSASTTFKAGYEYDLAFDCVAAEGVAKIGDYFYSDFTHSTDYDETKNCVGVVFAISDNEGAAIDRTKTSGYHGFVVALSDVNKYAWSFSAKYVFDIPRLANVANVDGSNAYGFLPFHPSAGSLGYSTDADVKVAAAINADGNITSWPTQGALADFNGKHNTELADTAQNKFPAAYYASAYNANGLGGNRWYLPSAGEMALVYALDKSKVLGSQTGYVPLREFSYWTSTECDDKKAWVLQAFNGKLYANYKTSVYYIRPIMTF